MKYYSKKSIIRLTFFIVILIVITIGYFIISSYIIDIKKSSYNVILISLDTLRADHIGIYGYNRDTTPYIDKFAKKGILFENVFAQSPNTIISHATMLTSLHPLVHEATPDYILGEEYETLADYFKKNGYKTGGFTTHGTWLNKEMGFAQGFDDFKSDFLIAPHINEFVFKFLNKNSKNKFFLFVHYYDMHSDYNKLPYDTLTDYDRKFCKDYKGNFTGCRNNFCASIYLEKVNSNNWTIPGEDLEYITALYDGGIAYTDYHVNQLFDRLKKLGIFDNSLIIITSDHGEEFMEHGKMLHMQIYKELMHVPLIIKFPGENEHKRIKNPVGIIDIMPTILDIVGIKYDNFQGKSLLSIINNNDKEAIKENRFIFSTLYGFTINGECNILLRNRDYCFFTQNKFTKSELYDIKIDPGEKINIANKKKNKEKELLKNAIEYYNVQWRIKKRFKHRKKPVSLTKKDRERLKSLGYLN